MNPLNSKIDLHKAFTTFKNTVMDKYTTDGKYHVMSGKTIIARSYIGHDGYEVRILQGLPRMETIEKINKDCPQFLINNSWSTNRVPKLFSK